MGNDKRTGQYVVFDQDLGGIKHARTIMRVPEPQKWSLDRIKEVSATPYSTHVPDVPEVTFREPSGQLK